MSSVVGEVRGWRICPRCRGELLPDMPRAAFVSDMWRAPAKGMTRKPDAKAERIKAKKAARSRLRSILAPLRGESAPASQTFSLTTTVQPVSVDEECQDCLKLNRRSA